MPRRLFSSESDSSNAVVDHWKAIRDHVLPEQQPEQPLQQQQQQQQARTYTPQAAQPQPQTPPPQQPRSLAQRFGFRQVIEHVQVVAADSTHRLAQEVLQACHAARFGVGVTVGAPAPNKPGTLGSVISQPFSTQHTVASASSSSFSSGAAPRGARRPPSEMSLQTLTVSSLPIPSLRQLHQVLHSAAGSVPSPNTRLPHESQVMSVCLRRFLAPPGIEAEEERILALECWSVVIRSWIPDSPITRPITLIKAALARTPHRLRILSLLSSVLFNTPPPSPVSSGLSSRSSSFSTFSPSTPSSFSPSPPRPLPPQPISLTHLATLFHALAALLASHTPHNAPESAHARDILARLLRAPSITGAADLSRADVPLVYGTVSWSPPALDDEITLRALLCLEGVVRAAEDRPAVLLVSGAWWDLLEARWPTPTRPPTPLQTAITLTALTGLMRIFQRALVQRDEAPGDGAWWPARLARVLSTRARPAVRRAGMGAARAGVVRVVLALLLCDGGVARWARRVVGVWWTGEDAQGGDGDEEWACEDEDRGEKWGVLLRDVLVALPSDLPTHTIAHTFSATIDALADQRAREDAVELILPVLFDHLRRHAPPDVGAGAAGDLLCALAQMHPQVLFKPVFQLAILSAPPRRRPPEHASADGEGEGEEDAVVAAAAGRVEILTVLSRYVPDWWRQSAEMTLIALMSDPEMASGDSTAGCCGGEEGQKKAWAGTRARFGQIVLLVEIIVRVRAVRLAREGGPGGVGHETDRVLVDVVQFVTALEARLGIFLEAREKHTLVPPIQRRLLCVLLCETRLLTRNLKSAAFLPIIVNWFLDEVPALQDDNDTEEQDFVGRIRTVYDSAEAGLGSATHRRSTPTSHPPAMSSSFAGHHDVLRGLLSHKRAEALHLLVALSGLLSVGDYARMGEKLWRVWVEEGVAGAGACFMVMQCAEKTEHEFQQIVRHDLQHPDPSVKLAAIRKLGTLANWRFQLLSQPIILDRTHRRPFKLTRGPLPFVATDMGSGFYVRETELAPASRQPSSSSTTSSYGGTEQKQESNMPLELRKRLQEIGWAQDEEMVDERLEWRMRPMTLLPFYQIDKTDSGGAGGSGSGGNAESSPASPVHGRRTGSGDGGGLLRRRSTSGGAVNGMKRRAVFVPALAMLFIDLASLVFDPHFAVASAARGLLVDLMRNEPSLVTRPVLDLLADPHKGMPAAISALRAFLHVRDGLPFGMAHFVLNSLAGYLKFSARQVESAGDTLRGFAHTVPILSKLVTQVTAMSILEMRRAKVEIFLVPSGPLWFAPSAPSGPMFPRNLGTPHVDGTEPVPPALVGIVMIRLAQNMTFLSMLKRKPQDVNIIRKSMSRFALPSRDPYANDTMPLQLAEFAPRKLVDGRVDPFRLDRALRGLSLMLSRSYLLLLAQVFRSMSRHLNDRNEFVGLVYGLNKILLAHGDDISIVSQAMIALMVASTRFRRLFTSSGAFRLFMPAVLKVYAESTSHEGIRLAIEYAASRFYAQHGESFLFQTLDVIGHVMMLPRVDGDWMARSVYALFSAVRRGIVPTTPDIAGIHNANKAHEREALMLTTADEKPQALVAALQSGRSGDLIAMQFPEEYESKRLAIDNFVRLFLTVIAHDPGIFRAEYFLRFLRHLVPDLYNSSLNARSVLKDGIDVLGTILARAAVKPKPSDSAVPKPNSSNGANTFSIDLEKELLEKSQSPSDLYSMRQDYLSLIVAFSEAGGQLEKDVTRRTFDLIKLMLRDSSNSDNERINLFFTNLAKATLLRQNKPSAKEAVVFLSALAPLIGTHAYAVDFAGVFDAVAELATNSLYANDPTFSQLVAKQLCSAGLNACDQAASHGVRALLRFPLRHSLVTLLANAVFLNGGDIMAEVEKRNPSYEFLAGIVLPLVLTAKTTAAILSEGNLTEARHQSACSRSWIRLLSFVMSACHKSDLNRDASPVSGRLKSQDKQRSRRTGNVRMATLVTAVQIIKAISVKAESELSLSLPGIWSRIGALLKSILSDGSATFAFTPQNQSAAPSPFQSPRASLSMDHSSSHSIAGRVASNPRVLDYTMWSLFELLCVCRNALMLQIRGFIHEKTSILDQELKFHLTATMSQSRRNSATSPFSKPRRHLSGLPMSDSLSPSQSLAASVVSLSQDNNLRQAGFQRSPQSPSGGQDDHGRRIIHLGPVEHGSPSARGGTLSPGLIGDVRRMERTIKIRSESLVSATYRRIRLVQLCMGYHVSLLPLPNDGDDADLTRGYTWSKQKAMEAIVKEMKELVDEFDESFLTADDYHERFEPDISTSF